MVDVSDLTFVVEIDEEPLMSGVEYLREDVLERKHKCPECETSAAQIKVETKERVTSTGSRAVVLVATCNSGSCDWEHRLLTGVGITIEGPVPREDPGEWEWGVK
jgi:hypothetical protein